MAALMRSNASPIKVIKSGFLFSKRSAVPFLNSLASFKANYSDAVHDHFRNPRNVGSLDANDPNVGTAIVGKAACGDVIKLQVKVEDGTVVDAKFKTFGCGSAVASSSYVTELIKGRTCEEALGIKNTEIAEHLSLPPVKIHCSMLAEDSVRQAIWSYMQKNKSEKTVES